MDFNPLCRLLCVFHCPLTQGQKALFYAVIDRFPSISYGIFVGFCFSWSTDCRPTSIKIIIDGNALLYIQNTVGFFFQQFLPLSLHIPVALVDILQIYLFPWEQVPVLQLHHQTKQQETQKTFLTVKLQHTDINYIKSSPAT